MSKKKLTRRVVVWEALDGWRWRLFSSGRIIAESGEAYTRRRDAVKAARNVFAGDFPITLQWHEAERTVTEELTREDFL